jgi:hypothetical protein
MRIFLLFPKHPCASQVAARAVLFGDNCWRMFWGNASMVGTSEFSSVSQACEAAVWTIGSVEPQVEEQDIYSTGHRAYQSLYPALRDLFHRSGGA